MKALKDYCKRNFSPRIAIIIIVMFLICVVSIVSVHGAVDDDIGIIIELNDEDDKALVYNITGNAFGWYDYELFTDVFIYESYFFDIDGFGGWVLHNSADQVDIDPYLGIIFTYYYDNGYSIGRSSGMTQGYSNGYDEGEIAGYIAGYDDGTTEDYDSGYSAGQIAGRIAGYDEGTQNMSVLSWIKSLAHGLDVFLNISLIPPLTLGGLLSIPLILVIIAWIVRFIGGHK